MKRFWIVGVVIAAAAVVAAVLWSRPTGDGHPQADIHLRSAQPLEGPGTDIASLPPPQVAAEGDGVERESGAVADVNEVEHLFVRGTTIYLGVLGFDDDADRFHALARRLQATGGALEADHYSELRSELERAEDIRNGRVTIEAMGCGRIVCLVVFAASTYEVMESFRRQRVNVRDTTGGLVLGIGGITLTSAGVEERMLYTRPMDGGFLIDAGLPPDDQ